MKTNLDLLSEVIESNRAQQKRARELNVRAGEKVFSIFSRTEWEEWLRPRLLGAVSVATIPEIAKLVLPALDETLIEIVVRENPDTIELLGQATKVEYRDGYDPRVRIDFRGAEAKDWQKLPEEIRLPGGREVVLYSSIDGYYYSIEAKSSQFKVKARECLNQGQWDNWRDRPLIGSPEISAESMAIPEIITAPYGTCVVTGDPLLAFGTVVYNHNRYYSSDPYFKSEWYRSREEAEKARANSAQKLEAIRAEVQEKLERDAAMTMAKAAQEKTMELYGLYHYSSSSTPSFSRELLDRLYNCRYAYLPSTSLELKQWTIETEALIAEVEVAVAEAEQMKAEEERLRREEEARAEAKRAQIGGILLGILQNHYSTCSFCGQAREWNLEEAQRILEYGNMEVHSYCEHMNAHPIVRAIESGVRSPSTIYVEKKDADVLSRVTISGEPAVTLALFHKWGNWNVHLVVDKEVLIRDGEPVFEQVWKQPSEQEMKISELERLAQTYAEDTERAEADVQNGYAFVLSFREGKNPKTGAVQLEAGDKRNKFIVDQWSKFQVVPGKRYYCREKKEIVNTGSFRLVAVEPYLEAGRDVATELEAIRGTESKDASVEKVEVPKAEQVVETGVSQVSSDMLAALQNKFRSAR